MIFQAKTLEETYLKASEHFKCSVTEFETINVIQAPSSFLFGFIQKDAIVEIIYTKTIVEKEETILEEPSKEEILIEENNHEVLNTDEKIETSIEQKVEKISELEPLYENFDDFEEDEELDNSIDDIIDVVSYEINSLFKKSCFELNEIKVSKLDEETILVEFQGEDSALLIGKEGYRYNALSYMIFNWINQKYGLKIRLEVAEFLKNQENMMHKLLSSTIEEVELKGKAKTKPFNGILVHIAVDILREEFPNKYVGIKQTKDNEKYIIINEFLTKDA
jgi:spoIIIJ-associated protein